MTPAGDVAEVTDQSATLGRSQRSASRTFGYDFLDRLTGSDGWLSYQYDGNGDRTSETVEGAQASYTYVSGKDRLDQQLVTSGGTQVRRYAFQYDYQQNATVLAKYNAAGTTYEKVACLRHDVLGRLTLVGYLKSGYYSPYYCSQDSSLSSVTARFKYDARGRRIARWTPATGTWTYVVSDGSGNPLSELALVNGTWTKVRDYVWLDGRPLAQIEYPGPAGSGEGYVYYQHGDHLGLPRALTNAAGAIVWEAVTRPYGDLAETTAVDPLSGRVVVTDLRLPGQYDERLLGGIGLQGPYYNWNRWYVPGMGRYLEADPVALYGWFNTDYGADWYNYARANPAKWTDRTGMFDNGSCPGCEDTCCCAAMKYGPDACPGAAPPKPRPAAKPKPAPKPDCKPIDPPPPPPPGKGCRCTCLGMADPNWNKDEPNHGDRDVGMVWFDAECRAECRMRGFAPEQYQCPRLGP